MTDEHFHTFFELAPLPFQSLDSDGRITAVNQAWHLLFGYEQADVLGQWFGKFLTEDHQQRFCRQYFLMKEKTGVHRASFEMACANGNRILVSVDARTITDPDGKFKQMHWILSKTDELERIFYHAGNDTYSVQTEAAAQWINSTAAQRTIASTTLIPDTRHLKFEDIFVLEDIQAIQDSFADATGIASIITNVDGTPITRPSNFSRLCNNIIRKTPLGLQNCMRSDAMIGRPNSFGPTVSPCLSGGLLDAGASISLGNHHIANWLIGQIWDTSTDEQHMLRYAREIGADEETYTAALAEITRMPREQFEKISRALYIIAGQLSKLAVQNVEQARAIIEREQANIKLRRVNRLYSVLRTISNAAVKADTPTDLYQVACQVFVAEGGFRMAWIGLVQPESGWIRPAAWMGEEAGYLASGNFRTQPVPEGQGPVGRSVRENKLVFCNDIETDPNMLIWREQALLRGYNSLASFPLQVGPLVIGVMTVYSEETDYFDEEETRLLNEVGATLSFTLEALEKEKYRQNAEKAMQESKEKYQRLFSSANDAIFVYPIVDGKSGNFIEVNQVACERLGYTQAELLEMTPKEINAPVDNERIANGMAQLIREQKLLYEYRHVRKDGRMFPVEVSVRTFEYQNQTIALSIARDISERKQAEARIQNQLCRLSGLRAIDSAINAKLPLQQILEIVLTQVIELMGVSAADILFYNSEDHMLVYGWSKGFKTRIVESTRVPFGTSLAGIIAAKQTSLKVPDLSKEEYFSRSALAKAEHFTSYQGAPLISKGKVLGVLETFHTDGQNTEKEWWDYFETLAGQAAIAIDDSQMFEKLHRSHETLRQAYDETIEGWSRALDLRDHETEGHSRRVTEVSQWLAKEIGLPEPDLVHMRWGALLHDIGKVGVPDRILLKPGKLTAEEWQTMAQHPQYAWNLLSPIDFLRPVLDIPFCHHEKWDGSGYPRKISGENIPLSARIFAVADVWDALTSDRPYRKAWPEVRSLDYIAKQSGKHFDPKIAAEFLKLMAQSR